MKTLVASIFALALLGAGVANAAESGAGAHIGPVGVGVGVHAGTVNIATIGIAAAGAEPNGAWSSLRTVSTPTRMSWRWIGRAGIGDL